MKKTLTWFCVLFLFIMAGCDAAKESSEALPNTEEMMEYAPEVREQTTTGRGSFVQTEEGCYYQSGELIYFIPAGAHESYPLCGKPDCLHNDRDCNAYCGWAFGYYDEALYAIMYSDDHLMFDIVKMNTDGTNHVTVHSIEFINGTQFYFHNGMLLIMAYGNDEPLLEDNTDRLIVINLSDFSQREPFADYFANGDRMVMVQYFGEKIYGYSDSYKAYGENCNLMEWDIATGEARKLTDGLIPGGYAMETTFYYLEPDVGFREIDLATGAIKDCGAPTDDMWWALRDEEFIYLMGRARNGGADHTLYFLNWDYEVLDQIELTDNLFYGYVSHDRIYFEDNADYEFTPITHYIDKADIGSGELTLKTFEQT